MKYLIIVLIFLQYNIWWNKQNLLETENDILIPIGID